MSANPDRGEVAIKLAGKEYVMRPSYEAQVAIEQKLGVSMDELYVRIRRLVSGIFDSSVKIGGAGLKLAELAIVICEGVRAADNGEQLAEWTPDRVGELITKDRQSANHSVAMFIKNAVEGPPSAKKDEAAASDQAAA